MVRLRRIYIGDSLHHAPSVNFNMTAVKSHTVVLLNDSESIKLLGLLENKYDAPFDYASFRQCAISQFHVEENIYFYEAYTNMKDPINPDFISQLKNDFIDAGGKWELNLTATTRQPIISSMNLLLTKLPINEKRQAIVASLHSLNSKPSVESSELKETLLPAYEHVLLLLRTDVLPKYVRLVTTTRHLELARDEALWLLHPKLDQFLIFPNPINEADSRLNNLCCAFLVAANFVLDYYNLTWYLSFYIFYGYFARVLSGPRIDIQSIIVLFLLSYV